MCACYGCQIDAGFCCSDSTRYYKWLEAENARLRGELGDLTVKHMDLLFQARLKEALAKHRKEPTVNCKHPDGSECAHVGSAKAETDRK